MCASHFEGSFGRASLILEIRHPRERELGKRVLGAGRQNKLNRMRSVSVGITVGGERVERHVEQECSPAPDTDDVEDVVVSEHDGKRWFGFAMLVGKSKLRHDGQLVRRVVRIPLLDIRDEGLVVHLVATEAEVERRRCVESERAPHAQHEGGDTCEDGRESSVLPINDHIVHLGLGGGRLASW